MRCPGVALRRRARRGGRTGQLHLCYRYADTTRDDPAPPDVEHCKGLGLRIGRDVVYDY